MRIVGLVSTYKEGRLAVSTVRSLLGGGCCDVVWVFDGPIGDAPATGPDSDWSVFRKDQRVQVREGQWDSDAAKRTAMLEPTRRYGPDTWGVILDGDEILLHGEYLPDLIEYAIQKDGERAFGFPLRLMEVDGSCAKIGARVLRLDVIERYLISSYHLLLYSGAEVSLPNVALRLAGEPDLAPAPEDESYGMQRRRPVMGEPHILHRSIMRSAQRGAVRQHRAEQSELEALIASHGEGDRPVERRPEIWTPS